MSLIRGTSLQGFPELVTELGADPAPLLAAAGVAREAVGSHDVFVGYRNLVTAVESAALATGAADFGRRLALKQGLEILGPLAAAARTAPTTGKAFQAVHRSMALYSPAIVLPVDQPPGADHVRLRFEIAVDGLPAHRQVTELSLAATVRAFRLIIGPDFTPISLHLPHDALVPEAEYRRYFGCPVRFAEPFSGFLVRPDDLNRPLRSDSAVHDVVQQYLSSITPGFTGGNVTGPVRMLVRRLLPAGNLDRDMIAAHLSLHPRTLQRRLAVEETTFADLVDSVRREEAERYLRDTDMPMGRMAGLLGYSEQSVLTRACRRWFGASGSGHRRALRAGAARG
ncbi:AraC family transcriptional regulator ligand-binding domain-containing protein [Streptomyces sp. NPDC051453]|uniref:AraC family transcriptional regulator n=1 Tax=Streptomyces sp. NPDC051453 TaxID=3154941 RepID=UPI003413DE5B